MLQTVCKCHNKDAVKLKLFPRWGVFHELLLSADFFLLNELFQIFFQEYHQSVKQFGSRSGMTFHNARSGSNCLQKLSTDNTCKQELNSNPIYFQSLFESLNRFLTGDFPVSLKQLVLQFLLVLTSVSTCASFYIIGI